MVNQEAAPSEGGHAAGERAADAQLLLEFVERSLLYLLLVRLDNGEIPQNFSQMSSNPSCYFKNELRKNHFMSEVCNLYAQLMKLCRNFATISRKGEKL